MDREELMRKYDALDEKGKAEMLEKVAFCSLSDDWDFNNYLRIGELKECELASLVSFLFQQDCFLMLSDILDSFRERFVSHDTTLLGEVPLSGQFCARMAKLEGQH